MISFVLLNWNGRDFLARCVQSLCAQNDSRWELILVDNGSSNESVAYLEQLARDGIASQLIRLPENRGFAVGMNVGIAAATGDLVVPLNSDVYLAHNFVAALHEAAARSTAGMWAAPVYKWEWGEGRDELTTRLLTVGGSIVRRLSVSMWHPDIDPRETLFSPPSCAPVFSRRALAAATRAAGHVFDERYISYGEDLDLYLRLNSLGIRCEPVVETGLWHIGSASLEGRFRYADKPLDVQALVVRNRHRNYRKIGGWTKAVTLLPWVLGEDLFRTARSTAPGKRPDLIRCYREAWQDPAEPAYRPFPIRFAGGVFSRSGWVLQRQGALPPLGDPHPPRNILLASAA